MPNAGLMVLLATASAHAEVAGNSNASAVLNVAVAGYSPEQGIVALAAGRDAGVGLGDRFWVLDNRGTASGTVYFVDDSGCAGRVRKPTDRVQAGGTAAILCSQTLPRLRDRLPPGVTARGELGRVPPGGRTAWLNIGSQSGLQPGDRVLIRRSGIPIARGQIALTEKETALAALHPVVGNALPEAGDAVELWPEPALARWGGHNSAVLAVTADDEGAIVTIVGTAADGLAPQRSVDLLRGGKYVGFGWIMDTFDPLSRVRLVESASAQTPREGDDAIVRARPGPPPGPLSAAIFRIEGENYCLIAAGETDGVQVGEKFIVRREDPADASRTLEVAELTVQAVKDNYAGARIRMLTHRRDRLQRWEWAERTSAAGASLPRWTPVGIVRALDAESRSLTADIDSRSALTPGTVVRLRPEAREPPAAAVVIHRAGDQAVLYVPPGWGTLGVLAHASVEMGGAAPPTTLPSAP